jgi:hypothetical protein
LELFEPLTQGEQMPRGCIAKLTQGLVQHDQQNVQPFMALPDLPG